MLALPPLTMVHLFLSLSLSLSLFLLFPSQLLLSRFSKVLPQLGEESLTLALKESLTLGFKESLTVGHKDFLLSLSLLLLPTTLKRNNSITLVTMT